MYTFKGKFEAKSATEAIELAMAAILDRGTCAIWFTSIEVKFPPYEHDIYTVTVKFQ